jgi:putative membrane protein
MLNHNFAPTLANVQAQYGWHMYDGPGTMMGFGWGTWGIFHAVFWLAILIAVAIACVMMIRRSGTDRNGSGGDAKSSALDLLDERYARGEIDREEYLQRKKDILER